MKNLKPIQKLLRNHTVSAEEFLSTPNISSSIRSQLTRFVNYCRTHKAFSVRMLQLAFNISYEELQNEDMKKASFTANQVLGNQDHQIAQMFFEPPPKQQPEEGEIKEEINEGGITSQAERLFKFDDDEDVSIPPEEQRDVQISREQMVALSFEILKNKQKNETCLGYLQKMYSFFIRHEPIPVLAYFESHPEILDLLLKNIQYSSISTLIAQLLTSEDKNKQYKYESLKKAILEKAIEQIFSNIKDEFFFDGALVFLDEILSATKQSYFQYFQDFKRISNILVTGQMMERFYNELIALDEDKLFNVSRYLEALFSRINSDNEDNRYYQKQQNEPTVTFQIDVFVKNISKLLSLATEISQFKSITKIHYFSFLEGLINSQQVKAIAVPINDSSFKALLDAYKGANSGGIVKNKIYQIIKELLSRVSQQILRQFTQKEPEIYQTYFTTLKQANYANTKNYNKNEQSAFDVSLIAQLTRKQEKQLVAASQAMGKDMKRICRKYETKIASFQSTASFSLEEQCNFYQYNGNSGQSNGSQGGTGFNLSIGRNNVAIPVLHLPDRYQNAQKNEREPLPQIRNSPNSPTNSPTLAHSSQAEGNQSSGDPVIEEEEVVVLTDKLQENKAFNLTQIMSIQRREEAKDKQSQVPAQLEGRKEEQPLKKVKDKEKLIDVPRLEFTSKLLKEGKIGDDQAKARFFTRHLAIYA